MAEIKTNAVRILDKANISYVLHTYATDGNIDGMAVAKKMGQSPDSVYKTLVTKGKTAYFVFVIPVEKELNLKAAARAVGEKSVEMIPVKSLYQVTGYIRGGCSPIGMKKTFTTVIDSTARHLDTIFVSGGRIGLQLQISPIALCDFISGSFAEISC